MPFFSIIIPVYNRAELFRHTLSTVLAQDFTDYEIVVVDDGSTDHTADLVRQEMLLHPNIVYVYQENCERGRSRNNGIRHARGQYVVLFDSDDLMFPNHLHVLYDYIVRLGSPDFIASKFDFVKNGRHRPSDIMRLAEGYYDYRLFLQGNPMACNFCLRTQNPSLHYFEEDRRYAMLEDWMFLLQNLKQSRLFIIDKVTVSLNDHDSRSMSNNSDLVKKVALAYEWMIQHVSLSIPEQRQLEAQVYYFSAIHSYLDGLRAETTHYLRKATAANGFRPAYALLWLKCLVGRKFILQLKGR